MVDFLSYSTTTYALATALSADNFFVSSKKGHKRKEEEALKRKNKKEKYNKNEKYTLNKRGKKDKNQIIIKGEE